LDQSEGGLTLGVIFEDGLYRVTDVDRLLSIAQ